MDTVKGTRTRTRTRARRLGASVRQTTNAAVPMGRNAAASAESMMGDAKNLWLTCSIATQTGLVGRDQCNV